MLMHMKYTCKQSTRDSVDTRVLRVSCVRVYFARHLYFHLKVIHVVLLLLQLLQTLQSFLLGICHQPDFAKSCQKESVKMQIQTLLESFRGAALATNIRNIRTLFDYLLPVLKDCVVMLNVYQNCPEMVVLVLEFYADVVDSQICYLDEVSYVSPPEPAQQALFGTLAGVCSETRETRETHERRGEASMDPLLDYMVVR